MALPETLAAGDFINLFGVQEWQFVQGFQQQRSATGGGETHYADRAPSLWRVEAKTAVLPLAKSEGVMVRINSRGGGLKTVLIYNKVLPFPSDDPDGAIIGATVPKLGAITDRLHVAFTGFPAGYKMTAGSYFGIIFDTSRYYLGQFAEDRVANGAGAIAAVEIWPPLPASVNTALDVSVTKPTAKFRITPGSAFPSMVDSLYSEISFSAEQTYSQ